MDKKTHLLSVYNALGDWLFGIQYVDSRKLSPGDLVQGAQAVVGSLAYRNVVDKLRDRFMAEIRKTDPSQADRREQMYTMIKALDLVDGELKAIIATAKALENKEKQGNKGVLA